MQLPYLRSVNYCVIQENLLEKCKVMACLRLLPLATDSTHVMWSLSAWCFSKLVGRQAKLQHLGCSFSIFTGSREGSVVLWVLLISGCDGVGLGLLELSDLNDMLYTWSPRFILCTNDIMTVAAAVEKEDMNLTILTTLFSLFWSGLRIGYLSCF